MATRQEIRAFVNTVIGRIACWVGIVAVLVFTKAWSVGTSIHFFMGVVASIALGGERAVAGLAVGLRAKIFD